MLLAAGCFPLVLCTSVFAQDSLVVNMEEVRIQALRGSSLESSGPFSRMVLRRNNAEIAAPVGQSLQAVLRGIPGITLNDRGHFALGERVMIRGMGWRSAFGVRGVGVLFDGIPLTLPDGQGMLDMIDPAYIRRAEVVRGPASTFWGNGSGGVLALATDAFSDSLRLGVRFGSGSYGLRRVSADVSVPLGGNRISAYVSNVDQRGFRDYSNGTLTRAALTGRFAIGRGFQLGIVGGVALQDVLSPGALTSAQVEEDARQADARNILTGASKQSAQFQLGATLYKQTALGLLSATAYGITRSLDNPLSYAVIELNRTVSGGRLQLENQGAKHAWGVGLDAGFQSDDRANFDNVDGEAGSAVLVDQDEWVRSLSAFSFGSYQVTERFSLVGALRLDAIHFELDNHLPGLTQQNGSRNFSALSPSVGVSWTIRKGLVYGNYSTAFETPTTTELVNKPSGAPGLNDEVGAQRTHGFEVGVRGVWRQLGYDVTLFNMMVHNQLQSFQDSGGRTYFRNEGSTRHRGVEVALMGQIVERVDLQLAYTGSAFLFDDTELKNNRIPGLPAHHISVDLTSTLSGIRGALRVDFVSDTFANNQNTATNSGYVVVDVDVAYADWFINNVHVQPFLRLSNVLDTTYNGSMVINAFGGRYFEPSPGRTVQAGVSLDF